MAVFKPAWLGSRPASCYYHGPSLYELAVPCAPYSVCDYVGVPSVVTHYYNTVTTNGNGSKFTEEDNRRFLLDRSIFDWVNSHWYLSLSDPKLQGWYLYLSPEDRKLIQDGGGFYQFLQRHPALELSEHHVYVKHNIQGTSPAKPAMTSQKKSGGKKCTCEEELNKLPSPVKETLKLLGCCSDRDEPPSGKHPNEQPVQFQDSSQTAFSYHSSQDSNHPKAQTGPSLFELNKDAASWQMTPSSSSALCKDPAAPASFSVDMELERCRKEEKLGLWSQTGMTQGQSANLSHPEVSALQSDWSTLEQNSSKYYSFNSAQMDSSEFTDSTVSKLVNQEKLSSKAASLDHLVYGKEGAVDDKEAVFSCGDSNNICSVMKDDQSILAFAPREERNAAAGIKESDPSAETFTSAPRPVTKHDVMVGTEPAQRTTALTQTEAPGSSDKLVITEVHMADLDYLTKEFVKLRAARAELKKLKEKMKSPGCKQRKECECFQRAQQAELGLLALQYNMCRQHCWRLYCTSAEGDRLTQGPKDPPANIFAVVQQLESDFNQMRDEILAGVPLKQLKPLTVDCGKILTAGSYSPAQTIVDVLGNVSQTHQTSSQEKGCAVGQSRTSSPRKAIKVKKVSSKVKRAVTRLLREGNMTPNAQKKPEEKQTAACKELNSSEAWYDAEEDLQPPGPETGPGATKDESSATESCSEDVEPSFLFVSNLPDHVTKSDVMMWFEKYNPTEVSILKHDVRVAIVTIRGSQSAEAAAGELNGCNMQGHTLHVQVIRPTGGSQNQASDSISQLEAAQADKKPQTSNAKLSKPERKLVSKPPISTSPTAEGTCVPGYYCTMGGFDHLMSELRKRHPEVSRQKIVDALVSLRAKHHGVLSGLPLSTIRDETSELLTSTQ